MKWLHDIDSRIPVLEFLSVHGLLVLVIVVRRSVRWPWSRVFLVVVPGKGISMRNEFPGSIRVVTWLSIRWGCSRSVVIVRQMHPRWSSNEINDISGR